MTKSDGRKHSDDALALSALLGDDPLEERSGRIRAVVSRRLDLLATEPPRVAVLSILGKPSLAAAAVIGCLLFRIMIHEPAQTERPQITVAGAIGLPPAIASAEYADEWVGLRWLRSSP